MPSRWRCATSLCLSMALSPNSVSTRIVMPVLCVRNEKSDRVSRGMRIHQATTLTIVPPWVTMSSGPSASAVIFSMHSETLR